MLFRSERRFRERHRRHLADVIGVIVVNLVLDPWRQSEIEIAGIERILAGLPT